ncbi:MAG: hypothetical protein AAF830_09370 [Pseudomonadota bacterium]
MARSNSALPGAQPRQKRAGGKPAPWARLFIAILGGYFATVIVSAAVTAVLPISRGEATALSLLLSGLIYTALFVYVFAVPSWWRAFRDLTGLTLVSGLILALAKGVLF